MDVEDAEFDAKVNAWLSRSVQKLRDAAGGDLGIRDATFDVCMDARSLGLTPLEVWDYLIISSPGLLGDAGLSNSKIERLYALIEATWAKAFDQWHPVTH